MSGASFVAVVDVGKTSTKLAVVDESGAVREELRSPSRSLAGPPYPHLDVERTIAWIVAGLRELGARWPIDTIVPVAHGAAAALLSGDELALPVMDYEFAGPEELAASYPAPPFEETFSPPLPAALNLGRQLHWQAARMPAEFARATEILLLPQYIGWRLSGRKASEVTSLGCHTDLWSPRERGFSSLARARGWAKLFPPIASAWEELGNLRPEVRASTGLSPSCRVLAGIYDSNASYLPHRVARHPPFSVVSTGTWVVCMAAGGSLEKLDPALDTLANVDVFGDPVPTSRFMGGRELEAIAGSTDALSVVGEEDVQRIVDKGILALAGAASESPRERAALGILHCALKTDECLDLVGATGPCIVEGSFVRIPLFASLLRRGDVLVSTEIGGTSRGAHLLGRWPEKGAHEATESRRPARIDGLERYRATWILRPEFRRTGPSRPEGSSGESRS